MNYHNITTDDMLNGDGLRTVLWVSGCNHNCFNCQNPQTHDVSSGIPFDSYAKKELFELLSKDYISGITYSGGDPLHYLNRDTIHALSEQIHNLFPTKSQWLYTGYDFEDIAKHNYAYHYLEYIDVIVDGKYEENQRDVILRWRGSTNQRVIDVQKSLIESKVVLHCE